MSKVTKFSRRHTLYLVLTALLTALTAVATVVIQIPVGKGYINFGDGVIFITACMLGAPSGFIAGGLGSMLADLFTGFAIYAPFTFFVKGLEGLVCGLIFHNFMQKLKPVWRRLIGMTLGGVCALIGYFLTDLILFGVELAVLNLIFMPVQVGVSMLIAFFVSPHIPDLFVGAKAENEVTEIKANEVSTGEEND